MYALENSFCLAFENVGWHGIESEEIVGVRFVYKQLLPSLH